MAQSVEKGKPFGGCEQTLSHYKTVGKELLRLEDAKIKYQFGKTRLSREFREGVCFVPVEVLESYLEDLLDMEASDESLCISRKTFWKWGPPLAGVGLTLSVLSAFLLVSSGATPILASTYSLLGAIPSFVLLYFSPPGKLVRRMGFARIVSHEISRRRGRKDSDGRWYAPNWSTSVFEEFFGAQTPESAKGAAVGIFRKKILQ